MTDPIVQTTLGRLRGRPGGIEAFLGVPYAAPPTGARRWQPAAAHPGWTGLREATAFGPACLQMTPQALVPRLRARQSEDCLYLNIWRPQGAQDLPVMVWIHGDGYTRGAGSLDVYDGAALAGRGVILVTLNYRLGLFGFLAHPELSARSETGSSGNFGLGDQIAALRWIAGNIAAFGGDPGNVTIFGQSAGGTCSHLLMASGAARGLFHKAILHSPGAMRPMASLAEAEERGALLGPAKELLSREAAALPGLADRLVPKVRNLAAPRGLGPIRDGVIVTGDDVANYTTGAIAPMPIMVGTDLLEGRRLADRFGFATPAELREYTDRSFGPGVALPPAYRAESEAGTPAALERVIGDTQFNYGAWSIARAMRSIGAPVWQYLFTQPLPGSGLPPTHDDELPYVFGTLDHGGLRTPPDTPEPFGPEDRALSDRMGDAWVRFARQGAPAAEGWPSAGDPAGETVMAFGPGGGLVPMPRTEDLEVLRQYFGHPQFAV